MSGDSTTPLVTAVIPTRNRPELVCRAVRSALDQTYKNLEVVVVVDGTDPNTIRALRRSEDDPRLRVFELIRNVGGAEARNVGVQKSGGTWIAFLDDDDEWLPDKIERQVRIARCKNEQNTIITCQYIDRYVHADLLRPQRFYRPGEPISEYLFCESSLVHPTRGFLATPTLMIPKSLLLAEPFTRGLRRNQDADWLLRVMAKFNAAIYTVPGPLAIVHNEVCSGRIGSNYDWRYSSEWAVSNRHLFTRRALGFFFATHCVFAAVKQGESVSGCLSLLYACWKYAILSPAIVWFFFRHAALAPLFRSFAPRWLRIRAEQFRHR